MINNNSNTTMIPSFDFASKAKITRKTLERLASFSKMQRWETNRERPNFI
jgi:hypothetical protein